MGLEKTPQTADVGEADSTGDLIAIQVSGGEQVFHRFKPDGNGEVHEIDALFSQRPVEGRLLKNSLAAISSIVIGRWAFSYKIAFTLCDIADPALTLFQRSLSSLRQWEWVLDRVPVTEYPYRRLARAWHFRRRKR
jgi:hypothetical protein